MNSDPILDKEYKPWLSDIKLKVRNAQQAVSQLPGEQKVQQPVGQTEQRAIPHIFAEYALNDINKLIGVSEYRLTESIPDTFKGSLPTIEQIEAELGGERG